MGLHVLGCRVDILGTNCKKLLKVKMSVGGGGGREGGVASASVRVIMSGGQQGAYWWIKKTFCRWECIFTADKTRRPPAHNCKWACNEGSILYKKVHPAFLERRKLKKLVMV